ncbi:hypothetical protein SmJEL517_g02447 [Synchytrium microbalum]|uniref:NAD-dependent epimerase/dehydratase domain-containing protein n=1 Tax=Synchytrium microbalum TaxID=1806994 RepID=A0A507CAJ2_9FUNG|nr:uncharacterized protein SmJEL517_g02447 [Synchytrium microbalum]TPX35026.1 hypothetical protein SmJEL517_g02447 [Synchytrium microbalum]
MRILVTGGQGRLGKIIAQHLHDNGHKVVVTDTVPQYNLATHRPSYPYVRANLVDFGETIQVLSHCDHIASAPFDAVVHLAAIPAPGLTTNSVVFQTNMMSTYNVFEACRQLKIKNIIYASSETVLGIPMWLPGTTPSSVPVDESIELPESSYSLSKYLSEKMAEQYARRDPDLKILGFRFSNVITAEEYATFDSFSVDAASVMSRAWNFWGYIDARDASDAVLKGLTAPIKGAEVFIIANEDTCMRIPNSELLKTYFNGKVTLKPGTGEFETLLSIDKAKRMLGYKPQPTRWRKSKL